MGDKDLIQQMKGRAKFCRDRGEIKTPELLERAINLLESQETERLKTELLAAEAEIARLQSALDELKTTCERHNDPMWRGFANDYDKGFSDCAASLLDGINRIIGTDK